MLRPNTKLPSILAHVQLEPGVAVGVICVTLSEAEMMAKVGTYLLMDTAFLKSSSPGERKSLDCSRNMEKLHWRMRHLISRSATSWNYGSMMPTLLSTSTINSTPFAMRM